MDTAKKDVDGWVWTTINGWGVKCREGDVQAVTEALSKNLSPGALVFLPLGAELFPPKKSATVEMAPAVFDYKKDVLHCARMFAIGIASRDVSCEITDLEASTCTAALNLLKRTFESA